MKTNLFHSSHRPHSPPTHGAHSVMSRAGATHPRASEILGVKPLALERWENEGGRLCPREIATVASARER